MAGCVEIYYPQERNLKTLMPCTWCSGRCTEVYRNMQSGSGCICAMWRSVDKGMAFKKVVNCSDRKSRKPLGDYVLKRKRERYSTLREWIL
jgi:hypothetical protein